MIYNALTESRRELETLAQEILESIVLKVIYYYLGRLYRLKNMRFYNYF